jgi:hypothetical protein
MTTTSPDDGDTSEPTGSTVAFADDEVGDEELIRRIRDAESRLRDGSAKVFHDADSLMSYWEARTRG